MWNKIVEINNALNFGYSYLGYRHVHYNAEKKCSYWLFYVLAGTFNNFF